MQYLVTLFASRLLDYVCLYYSAAIHNLWLCINVYSRCGYQFDYFHLKNAEVVAEWVGLRPHREPLRVESEVLDFPSGLLKVHLSLHLVHWNDIKFLDRHGDPGCAQLWARCRGNQFELGNICECCWIGSKDFLPIKLRLSNQWSLRLLVLLYLDHTWNISICMSFSLYLKHFYLYVYFFI